jgi:DNA (cytosine-5)-methyltransferase 1
MGFDAPGTSDFAIPVSDTRAYKQFGNSVVVPVFEAVARLMKKDIYQAVQLEAGKITNPPQSELF